jgi:hypothetical protein
VPFVEVGDELVKCRLALGEAAEMEAAFNRPIPGDRTEGFALEPGHLTRQEVPALEHREAKRLPPWPQSVRQAGKGATGPARTADHIKVAVYFPGNLRAATQGIGVAAAFGQKIELPEPRCSIAVTSGLIFSR